MAELISGLGGASGFGDLALPPIDDASSTSPIDIRGIFGPDGISFYGGKFTHLYINNNGSITFGGALSTYDPEPLNEIHYRIIAAYLADVDTGGGPTTATPGGTSTGSNRVYQHLDTTNGVFTVTWDDVGYYDEKVDKLNAFQIRLINKGDGDFDLELRYEAVNWTTGDAYGGLDGIGAPYSTGGFFGGTPNIYYQLPGAGTAAMLDLADIVGNTGEIGVWQFSFTNGLPKNTAPTDISLSQSSVDENQAGAAIGILTPTDQEAGETYTFDVVEGGSLFEIYGNTLRLIAGVSLNYEAANSHPVKIRVSDSAYNTIENLFLISVNDQNDPPKITSDGGGATAVISIPENSTAVTTVTGYDEDGGTLAYFIVGGADMALFDIDPSTGDLSFRTAPDFEAPNSVSGDNNYKVQVRVSDGTLDDTQDITVTVNDVYEAPPNSAPRFTSLSDLSVKENQTLVTTLTARDPDGDALRYSIAGGDDAALFSINSRTGALSFINPPDFEAPHSADGSNLYEVRVRVSDGIESTSKPFTITVTDVNEPPVFTGASALNIRENQTLIATLAANDPDADVLTFQIAGGDDAALFTVDADTGALSFIGAPDFETPSSADGTNFYEVGIRASDGAESASRLFTVTVTDTTEISRFFNITTGTHFYTADSAERDLLIATSADYVFEGETFSTAATDADGVSVYRFFNTLTGGHFYTADADEAASVHADLPQFSYEGEAFMAYDSAGSDRQAVHRFYNVETQAHFYTSDETERAEVLATLPQYSYEGVAFYVDFV